MWRHRHTQAAPTHYVQPNTKHQSHCMSLSLCFLALQEAPAAGGGRWQAAFAEVARICGFSSLSGRESAVSAVIQVVQNLKTSEAELKVGGSSTYPGP